MRTRVIAYLVVLATPALTHASSSSAEEICAQAEASFQQGIEHKGQLLEARKHFSDSVDLYRELHQRGVCSAALYRNLGNAALLANRWPEAIWAYHLGLNLDPNDAEMRAHLGIARAKVQYPPAGQGRRDADAWPIWLYRPTNLELLIVFAIAYSLTCVGITLAYLTPRRWVFALTALGMLIVVASAIGMWNETKRAETDRQTPLVILNGNTNFYIGNGVNYPQHRIVPVLPRGLEVRQLHRRGQWLQIRLTTGEVGWVAKNQALIIEP